MRNYKIFDASGAVESGAFATMPAALVHLVAEYLPFKQVFAYFVEITPENVAVSWQVPQPNGVSIRRNIIAAPSIPIQKQARFLGKPDADGWYKGQTIEIDLEALKPPSDTTLYEVVYVHQDASIAVTAHIPGVSQALSVAARAHGRRGSVDIGIVLRKLALAMPPPSGAAAMYVLASSKHIGLGSGSGWYCVGKRYINRSFENKT